MQKCTVLSAVVVIYKYETNYIYLFGVSPVQVLKSHCHHTKHVVGYGLSFMLLCWRLKLNTVILNCIESVMFHFCNFKSWVKFSVLENGVHSEQKKSHW
jgi:hypothetical protein